MKRIDESLGPSPAAKPAADLGRLSEVLLEAVAALARAGEVETACRLAARAWIILEPSDPRLARRFDALLHRLTPKLAW